MKSLISLFIVLSFFSCNSAKNSRTLCKKQKESVNAVLSDSVFRFGVSFISIGGGIDRQAKQKFDQYIEEFNSLNKVNLKIEIIKWGREGEVDYCFSLNELDAKLQEKFISEVKNQFNASSLVKIYENETCKHPRKG